MTYCILIIAGVKKATERFLLQNWGIEILYSYNLKSVHCAGQTIPDVSFKYQTYENKLKCEMCNDLDKQNNMEY